MKMMRGVGLYHMATLTAGAALTALLARCLPPRPGRPRPAPPPWRAHGELCAARGARLRLLALVVSAPARSAARAAVRLTWGGGGLYGDVAVAFVLRAPPPSLHVALRSEDELYGDLVVVESPPPAAGDRPPSTLSILEWTDTYCPRAPRLLKTDDDMFINVPRLLAFAAAPSRVNATRTIWGRVVRKSLPKRTTKSKYFVSVKEWGAGVFPDFATGPAYLMTSDCVRPLLTAAHRERYLRLEDVFVTGVLANKLGIKRVHAPEFYNRKIAPHPCAVQRTLAVHMVRYHEQFDFWRKLYSNSAICNSTQTKLHLWIPDNETETSADSNSA